MQKTILAGLRATNKALNKKNQDSQNQKGNTKSKSTIERARKLQQEVARSDQICAKTTTFSAIQKVGRMELKAELTVPELNLAFKVICNISGTVFLQVKQISPPKILEMVEIESQRREIQNSNFVLCASPRRSELEIYCSEDIKSLENRKNEARDEDPYPLFNCLQKFEIERSNAGLRLLNMLNYSYLDQNHLKHFECQPYFPLKTWRKKNIQEEKVIQRRVYLGSYLKYVRLPERRRVILDLVNFISQLPTSDEDESLFRMFDDESKKLTGQEVNFWAHKDDPNKLVELLSLLRFEEVSNLVKIVESVKNVDFGGKIRQNEKKGLESVLLRSIHVPGRVSWLIGACNLYPTDTLPQRLKIGENQVRQGLAIFRKSHPAWSRFLNLRTYFKAPIETEVFFLEEGEGYLKQNLKYVNDRQALVGDDVKRDTNTWFNIMGLRNKKLLKCFPDYLVNGVKTSELVRSPTRLAEKLKVKAEPLTCPVRFNPSKRCDKKFRAFDLSSYLIEVNKDHSTIYLIGCGKNLAYSFDLVAVNEVQLQPLDFYTPEIGFNVSFYNEKDSSIWLSNSSLLQGDAAKTVKESVRRLNFFETPMVTKITVPSLQQASAKPPLFQEGRFGYSESLSKYFSATETSIIIFENETDFSEIHKIIELKNLGTFERSKIKMLPLIPGQESGEKAVIVQYNRFRNWRTILFNFYKMEVVYDFDFEGDYCIKKDIELIKIEELNLNRTTQGGLLLERSEGNIMAGGFERGFLVSIVDSFFNRFLIINQTDGGGRAATQQQPGSCQIPYLVFLNSVNQSGELLSTSIIKSSENADLTRLLIRSNDLGLSKWKCLPQLFGGSIYRKKLNKYCFWRKDWIPNSEGDKQPIYKDFLFLTDGKLFKVDIRTDEILFEYSNLGSKDSVERLTGQVDLCMLNDSKRLYLFNDYLTFISPK